MERIRLGVPLRWTDIDAYGHVNNAAVLTLLEEARIAALWAVTDEQDGPPAGDDAAAPGAAAPPRFDAAPGGTTATLVARQEIEYLAPLTYSHHPVAVTMWVAHVAGASFDLACEIASTSDATVPAVRALTRLVLVDVASGRPRRLTASERAALEPYAGPVPDFRWGR